MTRKQFLAEVAKHGATLHESDGRMVSMSVEAPDGRVWATTLTHEVTCSLFDGRGAAAAVYAELARDMADGTEGCDDPECDRCHPVEE